MNVLEVKSEDFAVRIINLIKVLKNQHHEYDISRQALRSGTSIGANISEAQQAQSAADFISKMSIALKETAETRYWLKLLFRTEFITSDQYSTLREDCDELFRLLTSIIKTSRSNLLNK